MTRQSENQPKITSNRALPALGLLALLSVSALWAPPSLGVLSAEESGNRIGAMAACSVGDESRVDEHQVDLPPEAESKDNTDGLSISSLGTTSGGGGNLPDNTYYLRADGTAQNKSSATGCDSPSTAMNISRHNQQDFSAGDTVVLCSQGGVFRDTLVAPSSGSSDAHIVYVGRETAVLSAADLVHYWSHDSGQVYRANVSTKPEQVFIDGQFGDRKSTRSQLVNNRDWYWNSNVLYLYSSAGDPDNAYSNPGIESGARQTAFDINGKHHIYIVGITARHGQHSGIRSNAATSNVIVHNCIAEWNWLKGINASYSSESVVSTNWVVVGNTTRFNGETGIGMPYNRNVVIRRNTTYENGRYQSGAPKHSWTSGIKLFGNNHNVHGAVIEDNAVHDNGPNQPDTPGRGVGIWLDACSGTDTRNTIRRNLVFGNTSFGIFLEHTSNTDVYANVIYENAKVPFTGNIGMKVAPDHNSVNNRIVNNTSYNSHNIGLYSASNGNNSNNLWINNISTGNDSYDFYAVSGAANDGSTGSGNVYEFNCFGVQHNNFIRWGSSNHSSYTSWNSAYGSPTRSINASPQFQNPAGGQLWLTENSECIDTGENLGTELDHGLKEVSRWPMSVRVADQDQHGGGWDVGAYVFTAPVYIPPPN